MKDIDSDLEVNGLTLDDLNLDGFVPRIKSEVEDLTEKIVKEVKKTTLDFPGYYNEHRLLSKQIVQMIDYRDTLIQRYIEAIDSAIADSVEEELESEDNQ